MSNGPLLSLVTTLQADLPPALVLVGPVICLHLVCLLFPAHLAPGSPVKFQSVWVPLCSQSRPVAAEGKGLTK